MPPSRSILVLDSNTLVRAAAHVSSSSDRIVQACLRRDLLLLLSKPVLAEYRKVLAYQKILERKPEIQGKRTVLLLQRLKFFSEYFPVVSVRFEFDRDPDDAKFIELAIAGSATHIITHDKDLLELPKSHSDAAKRFRQRLPRTAILTAAQFVEGVMHNPRYNSG